MRKSGICLAVAVLMLGSVAASHPAKADAGATTIAAAVVAGVITVFSLKCTDASKDEYLCVFGPPKPNGPSVVCGVGLGPACPTNPRTGKVVTSYYVPKTFLERGAVKYVKVFHPDMKVGKDREPKVAAKRKTTQDTAQLSAH